MSTATATVPGTNVLVSIEPGSKPGRFDLVIAYPTLDESPLVLEYANESEARTAANTAWASIVRQRDDGTLARRFAAKSAVKSDWFDAVGSPRQHLCAQCGKPGTASNPLLHATTGYAHDTCDRPENRRTAASTPARTQRPDAVQAIKAAAAKLPDTATAHYALRDDNDVVKFYRVDRPQTGRWAGYTFLKSQASDDFHDIRNLTHVATILEAIAADVEGSLALYGHELGACGICNRTLTDETSRARGIGPICAAKYSI